MRGSVWGQVKDNDTMLSLSHCKNREAKQSWLGKKTSWFLHVSGLSGLSDVTETTLSAQVESKGEVGLRYKLIIHRRMLLKTYTR